jgi:shikimate kinase
MDAPSAVFLIGFMGAGKTTFGKKLAAKLGLQFVDLDEAVVEYEMRNTKYEVNSPASVKDLIELKGIDYFRKAEADVLRQLDLDKKLISTGGGAPCYYNNMQWMKEHGTVVFLNVDEGVIYSRLKATNLDERPLLKGLDDEGLKTFIHEKLQERLPVYQQAHIQFNPVKQKTEELVSLLTQS